MSKLYAGIGSRMTPQNILDRMRELARQFSESGYTLRSGGADGADSAFEEGARRAGGQIELWLPWRGFNGRDGVAWLPSEAHHGMAESLHPAWRSLSPGVRRLHARNVGQVLGGDLSVPVATVICWTPDGCESEATRSRMTGGTGTAIVLASRKGIPVINLRNPEAEKRLEAMLQAPRRAPLP